MGNLFSAQFHEARRREERTKYMPNPNLQSADLLQDVSELVREIGEHPYAGIVSIGPVGVGKSSNLNTVASYLSNQLDQQAGCGTGTSSLTHKNQAHILSYHKKAVRWKWMDTPGDLFAGLVELWKGAATDGRDPSDGASWSEAYVDAVKAQLLQPLAEHQIGCVIAMMSATELMNSVDGLGIGPHVQSSPGSRLHYHLQVLKDVYVRLVQSGLRMVVFLTKCDLVDHAIEGDVAEVQYSETVHKLRECISREAGMPLNQVHPVVNLVHDFEPMANPALGYLALFNVRCALAAARHCSVPPPHPSVPSASAACWETLSYPSSIVSDDGVTGRSHADVP